MKPYSASSSLTLKFLGYLIVQLSQSRRQSSPSTAGSTLGNNSFNLAGPPRPADPSSMTSFLAPPMSDRSPTAIFCFRGIGGPPAEDEGLESACSAVFSAVAGAILDPFVENAPSATVPPFLAANAGILTLWTDWSEVQRSNFRLPSFGVRSGVAELAPTKLS
ncbi:hypothetical protein VTK73DRAFT_10262 [Phialemonium thermophilum]|uniref:Uncharacterized protein n=1 Tax=Phialemonium thermophilum TaxID=223376 RepID=A0ABR3VXQ5_9PEZI